MYTGRSKLAHEGRVPGTETKTIAGILMTIAEIVQVALQRSVELVNVLLRRWSLHERVAFDLVADSKSQ